MQRLETPVFVQAMESYRAVERTIKAIDEQLRVALAGHPALKTYQGLFTYLNAMLQDVLGPDAILGASLRKKSLADINAFFQVAEKMLLTGAFDDTLIETKSSGAVKINTDGTYKLKLKARKIELLKSLIKMYKELVICKHELISLVPAEFIAAEKIASSIHLNHEVDAYKLRHVQSARSYSLEKTEKKRDPALEVSEQIERYAVEIRQAIAQHNKNIHRMLLDVLENYRKAALAIGKRKEELNAEFSALNKPASITGRISEIGRELDALNLQLSRMKDNTLLDNAGELEERIPGRIQLLERELAELLEQEKIEREGYNEQLKVLRRSEAELIQSVEKQCEDLQSRLDEVDTYLVPVLPQRQADPATVLTGLSADIFELRKKNDCLKSNRQRLEDQVHVVREVGEKCTTLTKHLPVFDEAALAPIERKFKKIALGLNTLCQDQSTVGNEIWDQSGGRILREFGGLSKIMAELSQLAHAQKATTDAVLGQYFSDKLEKLLETVRAEMLQIAQQRAKIDDTIREAQSLLETLKDRLREGFNNQHQLGVKQFDESVREQQETVAGMRAEIDRLKVTPNSCVSLQPDPLVALAQETAEGKFADVKARLARRVKALGEKKARAAEKELKAQQVIARREAKAQQVIQRQRADAYVELAVILPKLKQYFAQNHDSPLAQPYHDLERDYDIEFQAVGNACSAEFLPRAQELEKQVENEKRQQQNLARREAKRTGNPGRDVPPEVPPVPGEEVLPQHQQPKEPGFFKRHMGKIIGGITGFLTGAAAGAVVGAFFAPATFGLSIPVCAVIGGIIGAVTGGGAGVGVGAIVDSCVNKSRKQEERTESPRSGNAQIRSVVGPRTPSEPIAVPERLSQIDGTPDPEAMAVHRRVTEAGIIVGSESPVFPRNQSGESPYSASGSPLFYSQSSPPSGGTPVPVVERVLTSPNPFE